MHLKVLACDLDGTLADEDRVLPATWDALRRARDAGFALVLVTGRRLDTFVTAGPFEAVFQAIVAEDGAAIYLPNVDSVLLPFGQLSPLLLAQLESLGIPLERGVAIAATHVPHDEPILELLRKHREGVTIEYNRGAVMVLPAGATKGTGLRVALAELGYSPHNVLACGDAENDHSLLELAELGVAVAGAAPELKLRADAILAEPGSAGVRAMLDDLVAGRLPAHRLRPGRGIVLGRRSADAPAPICPIELLGGNVGLFGSSGSGKSWLAGLFAEELLRAGYQILVLDPEGDYRGLRAFPHSLALGPDEAHLPAVETVVALLEYTQVSLIVDLSSCDRDFARDYLCNLMPAVAGLRATRGRPHWVLFDEVHAFCGGAEGPIGAALRVLMAEGGVGLVTYRPSLVDESLLAALQHWIVRRLAVAEEIDRLVRCLPGARCLPDAGRIRSLGPDEALVCISPHEPGASAAVAVLRIEPERRSVPHVRHLHKYLRAPLPERERFAFRPDADGVVPASAASLWDFVQAIPRLPIETLRYHLERADFERWIEGTLHDRALAEDMRRLSRRGLGDAELRDSLAAAAGHRFRELERLL